MVVSTWRHIEPIIIEYPGEIMPSGERARTLLVSKQS